MQDWISFTLAIKNDVQSSCSLIEKVIECVTVEVAGCSEGLEECRLVHTSAWQREESVRRSETVLFMQHGTI